MPFGFQLMRVYGHSMSPALEPGDLLLIRQLRADEELPEPGSLVVVRPEGLETQFFIKRVIAIAGQTVRVSDRAWTLGEKQCFLLGDNTEHSIDSRIFGPVGRRELLGRIVLRLWPRKVLAAWKTPAGFEVSASSPQPEQPTEKELIEASR